MDGRDGVRADPLRGVKDVVYSWLLMQMDGGGVGRRAWECEKKRKRKVLLTRMGGGRRVWVVTV